MGINYKPLLAIGKLFNESEQALEFLKANLIMSEEDRRRIEDDGLLDFCAATNSIGLDGDVIDCYSERDYGFWLGRELNAYDIEALTLQIKRSREWWENTFPNVKPEIINTVMLY